MTKHENYPRTITFAEIYHCKAGIIPPSPQLWIFCIQWPKNWPSDPETEPSDPKMYKHLAWPKTSVCTKFQVDSSKTFCAMLQKLNLTFVTPVTLKIKVTTPIQIGFFRGLWGSYIPGLNLIAVKLFESSCGNGCLQTDRAMGRWSDS